MKHSKQLDEYQMYSRKEKGHVLRDQRIMSPMLWLSNPRDLNFPSRIDLLTTTNSLSRRLICINLSTRYTVLSYKKYKTIFIRNFII